MRAELSAVTDLPHNPFPGIEPYGYEHSALLYRREKEKRSLYRRIIMYRGTLLYGDQGVGKSSLVNAGLAPRAMDEGFRPYWIRVQPVPNQECVVDAPPVGNRDLDWLALDRSSSPLVTNVTIAASDLPEAVRRHNGDSRLLLIFDQFEEWVTLFGKSPTRNPKDIHNAQASILRAVVDLLQDRDGNAKVLLSFREDYLARMEPIFDEVPNLPDQYVRLAQLSNDQLRESIVSPFKQYGSVYSPPIEGELAGTIVSELDDRAPHRQVEAAEVQIVCHDLFKDRRANEKYEDAYARLGRAQGIFDNYFQSKLDAIPEDKRDAAVALFARLVQDNHRNVVSQDNLLQLVELEEQLDAGLLENTLGVLIEDTKLVKRQNREGVEYIEIASEFLIEWIHRARSDQLEARHKRQLAELDEQAREADEQARRSRRVSIATVVISALVLIFSWILLGGGDEPPLAEIAAIEIPAFDGIDASPMFDGDDTTSLAIPVGEERQVKVEVIFEDVFDIIDVGVVADPEGAAPKSVFIQRTRIDVPVGDESELVGRGAYGHTDSLTLIIGAQELDREIRIAELKFWRREIEQ